MLNEKEEDPRPKEEGLSKETTCEGHGHKKNDAGVRLAGKKEIMNSLAGHWDHEKEEEADKQMMERRKPQKRKGQEDETDMNPIKSRRVQGLVLDQKNEFSEERVSGTVPSRTPTKHISPMKGTVRHQVRDRIVGMDPSENRVHFRKVKKSETEDRDCEEKPSRPNRKFEIQ